MGDELKSTRDIVMEKVNQVLGGEPPLLTDDQRRRIAEIKKEFSAKVAEKKILLAGSDELAGVLRKLEQDKEKRIEEIYQEGVQEEITK